MQVCVNRFVCRGLGETVQNRWPLCLGCGNRSQDQLVASYRSEVHLRSFASAVTHRGWIIRSGLAIERAARGAQHLCGVRHHHGGAEVSFGKRNLCELARHSISWRSMQPRQFVSWRNLPRCLAPMHVQYRIGIVCCSNKQRRVTPLQNSPVRAVALGPIASVVPVRVIVDCPWPGCGPARPSAPPQRVGCRAGRASPSAVRSIQRSPPAGRRWRSVR